MDHPTADEQEPKSKSQLKREMHSLQQLGEALMEMPAAAYEKMPVPPELDEAIQLARRIKSHSASRRQLQLIGKVMRRIDSEPLAIAFEQWQNGNKQLARQHQQLELLRDQLIENDQALEQLINDKPGLDIQQLRQLLRQARQEKEKQKQPPRHYRKLFQFLKDLYEQE